MAYKFFALIVDGDTLIKKNHDVTLSRYEFKVYIVENGKRVVDMFHAGAEYDIIFMVMEMPIKDGPQATRELRAMGVNCMIVGLTSHGQDSKKQEFMKADDRYEKPLTIDTIESLLQKLKDRN